MNRMKLKRSLRVGGIRMVLAGALLALVGLGAARADTPAQVLAGYVAKSGAAASPERGQKLFTRSFKGDNLFESCAACHGAVPTAKGQDAVSGKPIAPLAPAANPARLTDPNKVDNALRLNCKDVVGRVCTAQEKADVISWLISLKP